MTINWEKLRKYRESQQSGTGKTFSMLVEAVEYIRDHPMKDVAVIGKSTWDLAGMKTVMKAVAEDLHVRVEDEFGSILILNGTHVLFALPGTFRGVEKSRVFVDHAVVTAFALGKL